MLFLVVGPSSHATPQLKAALRKLVRALPERFRAGAEAAASAVVIDPSSWDRTSAPPPEHLGALQAAVVDGVQTVVTYASSGNPPRERVVHPLGLVVKGTVWYLVAGTDDGLRTFRVSRVRAVEPTDEVVERPANFDLAEHWRSVMTELDERRAPVKVKLLVAPHAIGWLRASFGTRMRTGEVCDDGKVDVEVRAHSPYSATAELAGFGANIEVLEPDDVREHLARVGAELTEIYASR